MTRNLTWHPLGIDRKQRANLKQQRPAVIWFTGLSASGKSTLACLLDRHLTELGYHSYLLDGDNVRHGLCNDLGFSDADRRENIRRVGEVASLMADSGLIVMAALISPFANERKLVRNMLPEGEFVEVFVDTPITVCQQRDPKDLYQKALSGDIPQFTGINSPYETPTHPELTLHSDQESPTNAVNRLLAYLYHQGFLQAGYTPLEGIAAA